MFTGIIAAVGRIEHIQPGDGGLRLKVDAGELPLDDVRIGDSIAMNGVCLTLVERHNRHFMVDVSQETLSCTVGLDKLGEVNLEKALRLSDRLNGHLVAGHVDGVGEVRLFEAEGANRRLRMRAPRALSRYIAPKGSIAVQGVSLTVNKVAGDEFEVNLIPHTLSVTTLHALQIGTQVNLEIDLLARYLERMQTAIE